MENDLIVKANDLIEARYSLSLNEQKIILYAISKLDRGNDQFNVLEIKMEEFIGLLGTSKLRYTEIREVVQGLMKKQVHIETNEFDLVVSWVSSIKYIKNIGIINIEFSENLVPYLLQLKSKFTRYQLKNILYLKNKYSIRMYELLKQYQPIKKRTFSIEKLKSILMIKDKYADFRNLDKRVLQVTQDEINEYTDLNISYIKNKEGRSISSITFTIESKEDCAYITYLNENYDIKEFKEKSGLSDENFDSKQIIELYTIACEKLEAEYDTADDMFEYIRLNYLHMIRNKTVKNKYAYLKKALAEDYAVARAQIKFDYKIV